MRIEVDISTRDRYEHLGQTLWSLIEQTYKEWDLSIIDDSENKTDVRTLSYIAPILTRMEREGHQWRLLYGHKKGPHHCHQMVLDNTRHPYIWRMDDDEIANTRALEYLVETWKKNSNSNVAAIASIVYDPSVFSTIKYLPIGYRSFKKFQGKIDEYGTLFGDHQWRWHLDDEVQEVEHLYSSFLYSAEAAKSIDGYDLLYNVTGHREETDFTYRLFKKGYKLLVDPRSLIWHLRAGSGGIRSYKDPNLWNQCQERFMKKFGFKRTLNEDRVIKISGGLGDHLCATAMLRKVHENEKVTVSSIYPYMYQGNSSIDELIFPTDELEYAKVLDKSVYRWGADNNFSGKISEAWCKLFNVEYDGDKLDYFIYPKERTWAEENSEDKFIIISTTGAIPAIQYFNDINVGAAKKATTVKNWIKERWNILVSDIQNKLNLKVYQVGGAKDERINGCDKHFLGIDYRLSIALLERSLGFISVDTFLQHAGHAINKPGVVLFGPTMPEIFGHDSHINICHSETCDREKSCHKGKEVKHQWLSHEMSCDSMQCMKAISVEEVFNNISLLIRRQDSSEHRH